MSANPSHRDDLARLRKIEGQVQGVQRMIAEDRYCLDILTQLNSVVGAVRKVEESILNRHLRTCVHDSFTAGTKADRDLKVEEIVGILGRFRKSG